MLASLTAANASGKISSKEFPSDNDVLNKLVLNTNNNLDEKNEKINSEDIISLTTKGFKFKDTDNLYIQDKPDMMETSLKFIPYYCWSNRGENEMLVWVNEN